MNFSSLRNRSGGPLGPPRFREGKFNKREGRLEAVRARGSSLSPRNIKTWLGAGSCGERNFGRAALRSAPILIVRVIRAVEGVGREREEKKKGRREEMAIGRREGGGKREDREMQQLESWIGYFRFRVKRAKLWGRRELASPRLDRKEKVEMRAVVSHGRDFFPPRLNIVGRPHPVLIVTRSESQLHSPPPAAFSRVNSVCRARRSGRS